MSIVFTGITVFLVNNSTDFLGLLGRDATLTGRVPMWAVVLKSISMRPWLGYGFEAFWKGSQGPSAATWESVGWHPNQAHNGFLQIWLDLGFIGVILFCLVLYSAFSRAIWEFRQKTGHDSLWPLIVLSCFLLLNLTEANSPSSFSPLLWVLVVGCIHHSGLQSLQRDSESVQLRSRTLLCGAK
jgi:O-antigen ligase